MNARKKNKKKIIICALALVVVILVVVLIVVIVKKGGKDSGNNPENEEEQVYELPNTTYTGMEVSDVQMEYLEENNETMVSLIITNTTDRVVENESLVAYLLNKDGEILGQMSTFITNLNVNEQYAMSVILKGDLTSTTEISLQADSSTALPTVERENTNTSTEEKENNTNKVEENTNTITEENTSAEEDKNTTEET